MLVDMIFKEIKKDYERYEEVLQMEYFDDYIDDGTRYIFNIEGDKLLVYIRDDVEELEIMFTMDIEFILNSTINECIKEFNECYYYAPNVYEE
jgi:hypothetical protein